MTDSIPKPSQHLSVQEAAAEISDLINASPRSPWPSEIAAIIAKVEGEPVIYQCAVCVGRALAGPSPFCLSHLEPQDEAIVAKVARPTFRPDVYDEALYADFIRWRQLIAAHDAAMAVTANVVTAKPADALAGDQADAELERFHSAIAARPVGSVANIGLLAGIVFRERWPGRDLTDPDSATVMAEGPYCQDGEVQDAAIAALLGAIRGLIGMPKPREASDAALLARVRNAIVREVDAGERCTNDETNDPQIYDDYQACWRDLHSIQRAIPFPPLSSAQMLAHTEIAYHGADKDGDGKLDVDEGDCFERSAARLIEACRAWFGGQRLS